MSPYERSLYRQWVRYFRRGRGVGPLAPARKHEAYLLTRGMQLPPY